MRIPDEIEELVPAFMKPEKKVDLRKMPREEIDVLIPGEIGCAVEPGFLEKNDEPGAFPFKVTQRAGRSYRYWRRAKEAASRACLPLFWRDNVRQAFLNAFIKMLLSEILILAAAP